MLSLFYQLLGIFNQYDCNRYAFGVCSEDSPSVVAKITTDYFIKFIKKDIIRKIFLPDETALKREHSEQPDKNTPHYELSSAICDDKIPTTGYSLTDILQAVEQLDKECSSVYVLYMAGLSVKQISERVDKPENETKKIIKKAGKQLEITLEKKGTIKNFV